MAPVIWGLDLKEMQWGKFKSSYMFSPLYHLQKQKMIVYQIAMILCVVSESVGTAALSDYVDQQDGIKRRSGDLAHVHNDDYIGIASYNIFVGIAVATIFGSGFFFDLFWPERHESKAVKISWKISSVVVSFMALADAIAMTVIVATRKAYITGVSNPEFWFRANGKPNPVYRHNPYCVASTVILWPGVVASFASTYIMWISLRHNDAHGPRSAEYRTKGEEASAEKTTGVTGVDTPLQPVDPAGHSTANTSNYSAAAHDGHTHPAGGLPPANGTVRPVTPQAPQTLPTTNPHEPYPGT